MLKKIIFVTLVSFLSVSGFSQKKIKYKRDVFNLIKDEKFEEASPMLIKYLKQDPDHVNANYWAGKIFESKAYENIDITLANKAKEHYKTCRDNVTILEMNALNSSRYPDVSGLDGEQRLANFNDFLDKKIEKLRGFKNQIDKEMVDKNFDTYDEFISATNFELPDEVQSLELINIKSRYEKIILGNKSKLEGYLGFDAISPTTKEKVIFQGYILNGQLGKEYKLKKSKIKPEKKQANNASIKEIENVLGLDVKKYLGYSVRDDVKLNGMLELVSIGEDISVGGEFDLNGNNLELKGQYDGQNGYLIAIWQNYDNYGEEAIKLNLSNSKIENFRYEVRFSGGTHRFYETSSSLDNLNSNNYMDFDLKESPLVEGDSKSQILKYSEYVNNENEGADIILIGYSFENKRGDEVFIDEHDISENLRATLGKEKNYGSWYLVSFTENKTESEIFTEIKPILKIKEIKKTEVFDLEAIAEEYNKSLSKSVIDQLNSLGEKWVKSLKEGNYELYKSVVAKPYQINLNEFTKMTDGAKTIEYVQIEDYVFGTLIHTYDDYLQMSYDEVVKSGADESISVLTTNNIKRYGETGGTFYFIKYKGKWKIASWHKYTFRDFTALKALNVISKDPPKMCECVNETAAGSQYMAKKCFLYFKNAPDRSEVIDDFIGCLNKENYCGYNKTTKSIYQLEGESVSIFNMMNEIYFPDEEQNVKIAKLKTGCQ